MTTATPLVSLAAIQDGIFLDHFQYGQQPENLFITVVVVIVKKLIYA
jgi:hypothetical protein